MHKHLLCVEEIILHEACTLLFYHVALLLLTYLLQRQANYLLSLA